MDTLPAELITRIASFVPRKTVWEPDEPPFAPLATVDRRWHDAVESILFRDLRVSSNELAQFTVLLGGAHDCRDGGEVLKEERKARRKKLHSLSYQISHQELAEGLDLSTEHKDNEALCDYATRLSDAVRALWEMLASWKSDLLLARLSLVLPQHPWAIELGYTESKKQRIPYVRLQGKSNERFQLPSLLSVKHLLVNAEETRLWPASLTEIAGAMPALKELNAETDDWEKRDVEMRKAARNEFAESLPMLPKTLQSVELVFGYASNINQRKEPPSLLSASIDLFSRSLRRLSTHLTSLKLSANQISPEIFWPQYVIHTESNPDTPSWPHLELLELKTSIEEASGTYVCAAADERYPHPERWNPAEFSDEGFDDGREIGEYPQNVFRIRPEHSFFDALALSIARAAAHTPKLKALTFLMSNVFPEELDGYGSYAFFYRCGIDHEPWRHAEYGIDRQTLVHPRTEWVFECPEAQLLGWRQPEEARRLWREKCGEMLEVDVLTLEMGKRGRRVWLRRRSGIEVGFND